VCVRGTLCIHNYRPATALPAPIKTKYHTRAVTGVGTGVGVRRRTAANFVLRPAGWGRRIKRPRLTWLSVRSSPAIRWTVASFRGDAMPAGARRLSVHRHRPSSTAVSRRGMRVCEKVRSNATIPLTNLHAFRILKISCQQNSRIHNP